MKFYNKESVYIDSFMKKKDVSSTNIFSHFPMRKYYKRMSFFAVIILVVLFMVLLPQDASAAKYKIRYNKKTRTCTGSTKSATLDGKKISLSSRPSLIIGNVAYMPYDKFFKKGISATCTYNKKTNKIKISQYGISIVMQINSRYAYVNGKKKKMEAAPRKIKLVKKKITKVYIPSRFVTETLGYTYSWNSSKSRAELKSPYLIKYDKDWVVYKGSKGDTSVDGVTVSSSPVPGLTLNKVYYVPVEKVFAKTIGAAYYYNSLNGQVSLIYGNNTIQMTVNSKNAIVNGMVVTMPAPMYYVQTKDKNTGCLMVPCKFVANKLGFGYSWNSSSLIAVLKKKNKTYFSKTWDSALLKNEAVTNPTDTTVATENTVPTEDITASTQESATIETTAPLLSEDTKETIPSDPTGTSEGTNSSVDETSEDTKPTNSTIATDTTSPTDPTTTEQIATEATTPVAGKTNIVTKIEAKYSNRIDSVIITGLNELSYSMLEDSANPNKIYIDIPDVYNEIDTLTEQITDAYFLQSVSVEPSDTGLRITITKLSDATYYTLKAGNTISFMLCSSISSSNCNLKIPMPGGVAYSDITNTDKYASKKFVITIPGDHINFFKKNPIVKNSSTIKKIAVSLSSVNKTVITVTTTKLQGYKLNNYGEYIGVDVDDPNKIYDSIVVLDAGHGGHDSGACSGGKREKDINLSIIYKRAKTYFNNPDSPVKAYWTRSSDVFISLDNRAAYAKKVGADAFVSLHMNSASSSAKGLEVYYCSSNNTKTDGGLQSSKLASVFKNNLIDTLKMTDRGVKTANFVVIKKNTVPAILVELGFISNSSDRKKLCDATFQKKAAKEIYNSTVEIFKTYPTGR